ncbi:hypothetical protein BDR22DRAFT_824554 [Usnea florida]
MKPPRQAAYSASCPLSTLLLPPRPMNAYALGESTAAGTRGRLLLLPIAVGGFQRDLERTRYYQDHLYTPPRPVLEPPQTPPHRAPSQHAPQTRYQEPILPSDALERDITDAFLHDIDFFNSSLPPPPPTAPQPPSRLKKYIARHPFTEELDWQHGGLRDQICPRCGAASWQDKKQL